MLIATVTTLGVLVQLVTAHPSGLPPIGSQTCGFWSGATSNPITCTSTEACVSFPAPGYSLPNFGCCGSNTNCFVSTCLDYGAPGNSNTFGGAATLDEIFFCGNKHPFCTTAILYAESLVAGVRPSFLSYGCSTVSGITSTAYQGAYPVSAAARTTQTTSSSVVTSSSTVPSPTSTTLPPISTTTSSATSITLLPTQFPQTAAAQLSNGSKTREDTNIGVGVGVGVGGLLIIAGIAVWFRRGRQRREDQSRPQYEMNSEPFAYRQDTRRWPPEQARPGKMGFEIPFIGEISGDEQRIHELGYGTQ